MRDTRIVRNVQSGFENLRLHKLRSLLTTLGIVFGVGSVIAMLSVGEGASRQALDQIRKLGSNNIIVSSTKPVADNYRSQQISFLGLYGLLYQDAVRVPTTLATVQRVVPVKTVRKQMRCGTREYDARLVGATPDWFSVLPRELIAGRVLNERDEAERRNVVVLTEYGARQLLATQTILGQVIRVEGEVFEVVGIIRNAEAIGGSVTMPDQRTDAYAPISVVRERFGDIDSQMASGSRSRERVELHHMIVEVDALENVEPTAAAIEAMLRATHKRKDFDVSVPLALLKQAEATRRTFNIVLGSIACISLLVGGIGIMNIMLASVTERTREIGVRRAIGARRGQIVGQFLTETIVLSTAGGVIGICVGAAIPWFITLFSGMPTVVTPWSVALSLGISVGIGIVFGIYPAARAANLDPIVALRHE